MKKLIKMLIATTLLLSTLTALCIPALAVTFSDVGKTHWAYESVDKISEKGLMIGRGTPGGVVFDPSGKILGVEVIETLYRIADGKYSDNYYKGTYNGNELYLDENLNDWVELNDQWYYQSSEWAIRCGITYGSWITSSSSNVPDSKMVYGRFGSEYYPMTTKDGIEQTYISHLKNSSTNIATRSDVVLMLYFYVTTYMGVEVTNSVDLNKFSDWDYDIVKENVNSLGKYVSYCDCIPRANEKEFFAAWEWAVATGIIKGCDNNTLQIGEYNSETGSRRYITRAEYAVILDRFTDYLETIK